MTPQYILINEYGSKYYYKDKAMTIRHREDGPAVEWLNGYKAWGSNGKLHREDGPAVEYSNGSKEWFLNGKLHREDGPAIEYADGKKAWYLNGVKYTEEEFNKKTAKEIVLTFDEIADKLGIDVSKLKIKNK
jgi:hypothetical protein